MNELNAIRTPPEPATRPPAIVATGLGKCYRDAVALVDVSLVVHAGEILGVLGPNGAGKTTLIEILAGARKADCGTVEMLGSAQRTGDDLRTAVGFAPQTT